MTYQASGVVSASMDCILEAVGNFDSVIYQSKNYELSSRSKDLPSLPDSFAILSSIGRSEGCDLSGIPSNLRYYPDNKAILDVGESVILFCAKPPAIPRLAECFSPDSISFSGL
jgi:hypothetical protein